MLTIDEALAAREIIWGTDNIFKSYSVAKGDVDAAFAGGADRSSKGSTRPARRSSSTSSRTACWRSPIRQHGVTVWGSMQCPYYIHKALAGLFDLPPDHIRVVQMETGGGFGGKEEYPVDHRRPRGAAGVEVGPAGEDDLRPRRGHGGDDQAAPVADPASHRGRRPTAGSLAMDIDFTIDGGAYCTLSPVVLSRGTIHAAGPYSCPNVRVRGRAVATNVAAARRVPRLRRAAEPLRARAAHGRVAAAVGLSPEEFRRRNFIQPGDTLRRRPDHLASRSTCRRCSIAR